MIKTRQGLFETNSSSTHVLVMSPDTEIFRKFTNGQAYMVDSCPEWMEKIVEHSGSGDFIEVSKLIDFIRTLPERVKELFSDALDAYEENPDDTGSVMDELNSVELYEVPEEYQDEYQGDIHLYNFFTFSDGAEAKIEVNGETVTALSTEIYDD